MIKNAKDCLKELDFGKNEIEVYLALVKLGEAKASQIAKAADLPRTTAISILAKFLDSSYITSSVYRGATSYWIESPNSILETLQNRISYAEKLKAIIPDLYHIDGRFPTSKIIDTKSGIKNFITKALGGLNDGSLIQTIDTPREGNYKKIFSEEVEGFLNEIKKKKKLQTNILVPAGSLADINKQKINKAISIKEMPIGLIFSGSIWLMGNSLVLFSGNPPFLVEIKHKAVINGFRGLYQFLWINSLIKAT